MKPQASDIEPLKSWTDRQFGDWIRASFHDYFVNGLGRFAFEPLHTFFGEDYDVTEEMMDVFALLSEQAKTRFRSGLAIALADTELATGTVVDAILNLARRTRATHVLRVFVNKLLRDWQGLDGETRELDHAIVWTVGVLARFAGDSTLTEESVACLEALAEFQKVPRSYVLPLFKLLCEVRPADLARNLDAFWTLLEVDLRQAESARVERERQTQRERLVREVLGLCGRNALLSSIVTFIRQSEYSYNWWQQTCVKVLMQLEIRLPGEFDVEPGAAGAQIAVVGGNQTVIEVQSRVSNAATDWRGHWWTNFPSAAAALEPGDNRPEAVG